MIRITSKIVRLEVYRIDAAPPPPPPPPPTDGPVCDPTCKTCQE